MFLFSLQNVVRMKEIQEKPKPPPVRSVPVPAEAPRGILKRKQSEVPQEVLKKVAKVMYTHV